jgi:hypothetical protein
MPDSPLIFDGNDALLGLIAELYPRLGRQQRRNRPLICLITKGESGPVLPAVRERIRSGLAASVVQELDTTGHPPEEQLPATTEEDVLQ